MGRVKRDYLDGSQPADDYAEFKALLERHPRFVVWQTAHSETELRATVRQRGDERRRADLTVSFIATSAPDARFHKSRA